MSIIKKNHTIYLFYPLPFLLKGISIFSSFSTKYTIEIWNLFYSSYFSILSFKQTLKQLCKSFQGQLCNCRRITLQEPHSRQNSIPIDAMLRWCWINLDVNWKTIHNHLKSKTITCWHIIKLGHLGQENPKLSDYPIVRNIGSHGKPIWPFNSTYYNSMLHELYKVLKWSSRTLPFKSHWMQPAELQHMCRFLHYMNTYI